MIDKELMLENLKRYLDTVLSKGSNDAMSPNEVYAFEDKYVIKFTDKLTKEKILAMDVVAKRSGSGKLFAFIMEDDAPVAIYTMFGDDQRDPIFGYGHMNKEKQNVQIGLSIPAVAEQLVNMNYGQQRMLAEIVRLREQSPSYFRFRVFKENTEKLREMLEQGWH